MHPLAESLPRPLALVLGGGASLGAIEVGHLLALSAEGIYPDLVVGASVGSLNGMFVAADPLSAARTLQDLWRSVRRHDIFPLHPLQAAEAVLGRQPSLIDSGGLAAFVGRHQPADRIENLALPFHAVATDELAGRAKVLSAGDLRVAVMASAAIPGIYPPVVIDGVRLVDGGVVANVPIGVAFDVGARSVIVCDVGATCRLLQPPANLTETLVRAVELLMRPQVERELDHGRRRGPIIYLPTPCTERVSPMDFADTEDLVERARAQTAVFLADIGEPVSHGEPHRH